MRKPLHRDAERKYIPTRGAKPGYRDLFNARDAGDGPLVLRDCTSIEWPHGWKQEDAARWRKANGLERPTRYNP
jgi:hypothetical protein